MSNAATIVRICLAASALVFLSASLAEATYGPRTKIGNNYQQTSNTRSNNGSFEGSCTGLPICAVLFQRTAGQKPLIVQHVSCAGQVSAGSLTSAFLGTYKEGTFPLRQTQLVPVATTGGWWVMNSAVKHLLESGELPFVFFNNSAGAAWLGVECTISGTLQQ
jgi:hypothetical protein